MLEELEEIEDEGGEKNEARPGKTVEKEKKKEEDKGKEIKET